jgi:hypothetical protein
MVDLAVKPGSVSDTIVPPARLAVASSLGLAPRRTVFASRLPAPDRIVAALALMAKSARPVVLADPDSMTGEDLEVLAEFCEATGIAMPSGSRQSTDAVEADLLIKVGGRRDVAPGAPTVSFHDSTGQEIALPLVGDLAKTLRGLKTGLVRRPVN